MNITGIIAEYNPFHGGHCFHIEEAKKKTNADYCIVVMSGDFVQRGEPAVFDKYLRTKMALMGGADLVIELPSVFAVSSAEDFAACGVNLLSRLGAIPISASEVRMEIWKESRPLQRFYPMKALIFQPVCGKD